MNNDRARNTRIERMAKHNDAIQMDEEMLANEIAATTCDHCLRALQAKQSCCPFHFLGVK